MRYPFIRGEYLPDYAKMDTWKVLYACKDAYSQILIDECPVYWLQAISILQSQCANMKFFDLSIYNIKFRYSIKIFQNAKSLEISVENSYTVYHLMHTFLENVQQGGK